MNTRSMVNEVYSHVINVTVESLRKYLEKKKKISFRFNVTSELKSRWQARINCLFYTLEGSWVKFQETGSKFNEFQKKNENMNIPISILNFPLVCNLSWDFFHAFSNDLRKFSGFKSWVWNCLISQVINEGGFPSQSFKLKKKKKSKNFPEKTNSYTKIGAKYGKNFFDKYQNFLEKGLCLFLISNHHPTSSKKKNHEVIIVDAPETIDSELDEEFESNGTEEVDEKVPNNFILALTEKVYRRNTKWRILLKDGILHMNEKDFLFNSCKCEFFW